VQNLFLWVREQTCLRGCVCCLDGSLSVWLVQECARVCESVRECARVCESVWAGVRDFFGGGGVLKVFSWAVIP